MGFSFLMLFSFLHFCTKTTQSIDNIKLIHEPIGKCLENLGVKISPYSHSTEKTALQHSKDRRRHRKQRVFSLFNFFQIALEWKLSLKTSTKPATHQKTDTWIKHMWNKGFKWTQVDYTNLNIHEVGKPVECRWTRKQTDLVIEVKNQFILACINNP